ncbi:hypothetical protein KO493_12570 [Tamlana agarivorans]|uniref:Uncharacterized protein n=1 Tax=Pseudotamlana agarivorans TaxID=481183 RepID=A0ACC5UB19_9FLAO|nr:hypothetical protein [Tamlana agarivorans]MBU2951532.1 hypothetical protein [Tamlana agarivorans]
MLYAKKEELEVVRSYEYLHVHPAKDQVTRLHARGRVMLNGRPKPVKK